MKLILKKVYVIALIFIGLQTFGQGASLSPYDLKESYKEKKTYYKKQGTKVISDEGQQELDRIVALLEANKPNSYEHNLVRYYNSNYNGNEDASLFAAFKLNPNSTEIHKALMSHYTITGNYGKQKEFASKLKGKYSKVRLDYYRQLIKGMLGKYIVFSGEEDALPVLVLQALGEVPATVSIINLDFLQNDAYRSKLTSSFGFSASFLGNEKNFIAQLVSNKPAEICISTTVHQAYLSGCGNALYLQGLFYKADPVKQLKTLSQFWQSAQKFLRNLEIDARYEKALYKNYLPPLLTLYQLKKMNNEQLDNLKKGIQLLGKKLGVEEKVNELLKAYDKVE